MKNFNVIGGNVRLSASGTGLLSPNIVSFQSFVEGVANVKVVYDKAESFIISADMVSPKVYEKIPSGKPKIEEKIKPSKKARKSKRAAIEEMPSGVPEQKIAKSETPPPEQTEDKKPAIETDEQKKAAKEEPIEEIKKKTERADPFELKSITTVDDNGKVLIYLGLEEGKSELAYETDIISIAGKKEDWLKVTVKPATRGAIRPIKRIKSAFTTGRIRIEEDKTQRMF